MRVCNYFNNATEMVLFIRHKIYNKNEPFTVYVNVSEGFIPHHASKGLHTLDESIHFPVIPRSSYYKQRNFSIWIDHHNYEIIAVVIWDGHISYWVVRI